MYQRLAQYFSCRLRDALLLHRLLCIGRVVCGCCCYCPYCYRITLRYPTYQQVKSVIAARFDSRLVVTVIINSGASIQFELRE